MVSAKIPSLLFKIGVMAVLFMVSLANKAHLPEYCRAKTSDGTSHVEYESTGDVGGRSSLLWRLETSPPSFFFGTIHVPYTRVWRHVPVNVKRAFRQSHSVFFELRLTDPATVRELTSCQLLPAGHQLQQLLPAKLFTRLRRHLDYVRRQLPGWMTSEQRDRGLHADYLFNAVAGNWRVKRPVWVLLLLNSLTQRDVQWRGTPVLDLFLAQQAGRLHKHTGAVEQVQEQCQPLNKLNITQVIFALDQTLTYQESLRRRSKSVSAATASSVKSAAVPAQSGDLTDAAAVLGDSQPACGGCTHSTDDLIRHYNCGNLDSAVFSRDTSQLPPSVFNAPQMSSGDVNSVSVTPYPSTLSSVRHARGRTNTLNSIDEYFRSELIYKRNQRMGERIVELLWSRPRTSFFFAFGAGHFLGNHTVLDVIRQAGYRISRVGRHERIRRYPVRPAEHHQHHILRPQHHRSSWGLNNDRVSSGQHNQRPSTNSRRHNSDIYNTHQRSQSRGVGAETFSDLWVRIDGARLTDPAASAAANNLARRSDSNPGSSSVTRPVAPSLRLLTVLLVLVMALSPPRTN